ncbi:MAG: UDP-N-acetylmuramate--L-alanine ligase [Lachnospiraceae bacterium]|nr:UDP-N-acetylmuramate--L-alanine ligase [Lachnospiraceae bacterium]
MFKIDYKTPVCVHFIGIGGISMSGLAEVLLGQNFKVSGSDREDSPLCRHLTELGAKISFPQSADNITDDIDVVVYTAAIADDNPELKKAREKNLPLLTRAELLGQIMDHYSRSISVAGTHGKTTTSSMLGQILLCSPEDPTLSIGGIFPAIGSNIHVGSSDIFLTEACEYKNSYHSFRGKYSIILNIEADHLDFFKDLDDIRKSFARFAKNTYSEGMLVISGDIPNLSEITGGLDCRIVTFGESPNFDYYPKDITFDKNGCASFIPVAFGEELPAITLSVPGKHNVTNSLAAIAVARDMGIDFDVISMGLSRFGGTKRRFEHKGEFKGATVIDDYAHHPTEISASLAAARNLPHKRLVVVFQPHTYTRTKALLGDFAKALSVCDIVILAKIYAAREPDIFGISSADLCEEIKKLGTEAYYFETFEQIEDFLKKNTINDDLLITMGAGNVNEVGENLLS